MAHDRSPRPAALNRRRFLRAAALAGLAGSVARLPVWAQPENPSVKLPFENGERPLVVYPQKRALIRHTTRPPQLETPFSVFNEGVYTPNDAFFVRYHLTLSPPFEIDPDKFTLAVKGKVNNPLSLSLEALKTGFEAVETVAVNQCSGNSRGFFIPRVAGGQSGHGNMGNARWRGVRLKDVLLKAGVAAGARQVTFNGLDNPLIPQTPDFIKALDIDHALGGEVLLAYAMNGEDLPYLNGYPLRLVVPGYYGTYWIKHLHEINVVEDAFAGFWMNPAYRIPDNTCACVPPGDVPSKTVPINRLNVRSFITSLQEGSVVKTGEPVTIRGIAFDGGYGIHEVLLSTDGGVTWRQTELGKDFGKYSFREWSLMLKPEQPGQYALRARATNKIGQSQPLEPLWNPAGYMRNVVETIRVNAVAA